MQLARSHKIILAVIVALIVLIPSSSFVLSQALTKPKTSTADLSTHFPVTSPKEVPKDTPESKLKKDVDDALSSSNPLNVQPLSTDSATLLLGPQLTFKIIMEGRPLINQAAKVFLGIASGQPVNNPKYLLSFLLDVPANGIYKELALSGLEQGTTYTAYLKGPAQIATSSTFVAKMAPTDLGTLQMLTGDVNEDNIINTLDANILKNAFGSIPTSPKWNPNLDFNVDERINSLDLALITKNMNKIGASGSWYSTAPAVVATQSASASPSASPNTGGPTLTPQNSQGYWMWIPTSF